MNKKIISLFTFGLFLIFVGALGKLANWNQATTVIAIGLTFESLGLILFAWNHLKK